MQSDVVELGGRLRAEGRGPGVSRGSSSGRRGLAWTRDGKSVVFAKIVTRLWRVGIAGDQPPERMEVAGFRRRAPTIARSKDRLAFMRSLGNVDIQRFEAGRPDEVVAASSARTHIRLLAGRPTVRLGVGTVPARDEIWLAAADGSDPVQLTHDPGCGRALPAGLRTARIAFDSQGEDGHSDIWTSTSTGGCPRRLTRTRRTRPSRAGRGMAASLLHLRIASGGSGHLAAPLATGGPAERVTHNGGFWTYESMDGRTLDDTKATFRDAPLYAIALAGGPERKVVHRVSGLSFAVSRRGLHFVGCSSDPSAHPLFLLEPGAGRPRLLGELEGAIPYQLIAAAPDGGVVLYARVVVEGAALMMVEDFR